jgi:hypothetical protein
MKKSMTLLFRFFLLKSRNNSGKFFHSLLYIGFIFLASSCNREAKSQDSPMIIPNVVANFDQYPINEVVPINEAFVKKNKIKNIKLRFYEYKYSIKESEDLPFVPYSEDIIYSFDVNGKFLKYVNIDYEDNPKGAISKIVERRDIPGSNTYDLLWYDDIKKEDALASYRFLINEKKQVVKRIESFGGEILQDSMMYSYKTDKLCKTKRYLKSMSGELLVCEEYFFYDVPVSGKEIESYLSANKKNKVAINEYKKDKCIKQTYYDGNEIGSIYKYTYDDSENIVRESYYVKDETVEQMYKEFSYDSEGRLNGFIQQGWSPSPADKNIFLYDKEKGLVTERKLLYGENLKKRWVFSYDYY